MALSPKLVLREDGSIQGKGLFAAAPIQVDELLWEVDATATIIGLADYHRLTREARPYYSQIGADAFVLSEDDDYFWNHSCEPNCWSDGPRLFAMQAIMPGQEVTYDYGLYRDLTPLEDDMWMRQRSLSRDRGQRGFPLGGRPAATRGSHPRVGPGGHRSAPLTI